MTNYEHYKNEIDKIARMGKAVAVDKDTRTIHACCCVLPCERCLFNDPTELCQIKSIEWADEEYKEPAVDWSKVPIDTPILVRDIESAKWHKRHFAGVNKHGRVMTWSNGKTSWTTEGSDIEVSWNYAKLAEDTLKHATELGGKHPKNTRKDVLLEKFPSAIIDNGTPRPCAGALGLVDGWHSGNDCSYISCKNCWNTEVSE